MLNRQKTKIFCFLHKRQAKDEQLKKSKIFKDILQKTVQRFFLINTNNTSDTTNIKPNNANAHKFGKLA